MQRLENLALSALSFPASVAGETPTQIAAATPVGTAGQGVPWPMFWCTLALINGGLAQTKGRSGFVWWVFSLFLGPFATFSIVVLDAVPTQGKA